MSLVRTAVFPASRLVLLVGDDVKRRGSSAPIAVRRSKRKPWTLFKSVESTRTLFNKRKQSLFLKAPRALSACSWWSGELQHLLGEVVVELK